MSPDFAGEEAFEAADDLGFGLAFGDAPGDVGLRWLVVLHADDHGSVERGVGVAVSAAVEPVPGGLAGRGRDRGDSAELGESGLGVDAIGVIAGDDEHLRGDVGAHAKRGDELGCGRLGEFGENLRMCADLGVKVEPAACDGRA